MTFLWDSLWLNATIATCEQEDSVLEQAAMAVKDEKIAWISPVRDLRGDPHQLAKNIYDVKGACMTPGFIDSHTHLIYGGNRANEFTQRLQGVTYEEIALNGGGIHATVAHTRHASEDQLYEQSLPRLLAMQENGSTTVEIKSGYGLDVANELKMLRVARRLAEAVPMTIRTTLLGAHTIPLEYKHKSDEYIKLVCEEMIPIVASEKLADAVDVFCEHMAFSLEQTEQVFAAATHYGLPVKCHAEQRSNLYASILSAKYNALSVDHLEYLTSDGIEAIARSGTVAVLLPGAYYFLQEKQKPPIATLRQHHVPMAIATDCNPGTSPLLSLPLAMNMACVLFQMTPEEALVGVTKHAARALGLSSTLGSLTVGKIADFVVWNVKTPVELIYYLGAKPLQYLVKSGKVVIGEKV